MTQARFEYRMMSLEDPRIFTDPKVQRSEGVDMRKVDRMFPDFNEDALGEITFSERSDGKLATIDGAHRICLCRKVEHKALVRVKVFKGLTIQEEARLFLLLNQGTNPTLVSKFKVSVIEGNPESIEIDNIIKKHGWELSKNSNPGCLLAIATIQRVYRSASKTKPAGKYPGILDRVLKIITATWGHDPAGMNMYIIEGLAQLVGRMGDSFNDETLIKEMKTVFPVTLITNAKQHKAALNGTLQSAVARILVGMHNKCKKQTRLPEWIWLR